METTIKAAIENVRVARRDLVWMEDRAKDALENVSTARDELDKAISELTTVAGKAGKIIEELERNNVHLPDPTCMRCDVVLDTAEGFQTGICANCWKPETDEEVEFVDGEWKPKLPLTT